MNRSMRFALLAIACVAYANEGLAQARPAPGSTRAPAQADLTAAKAAFETLPEAERKAIQEALVWTGDSNASAGGEFGLRTFEAINAYRQRMRLPPTGHLGAQERRALLAAAQKQREAAKFNLSTDARTGIRIGIPERSLVKRDVNPNGGTRWQSADGKITLDTRAIPAGEADLPSLYERNLAIKTPGRQITYKLLRPDFFVISGETPTGKFYTRYAADPTGVRGFSLGYDKTLARDFDRIVVAIANSFTPFPEAVAAPPPPPQPASIAPQPSRSLASGVIVGPGRIVTSAIIETCAEPRVADARARILKIDKAAGLALLEWQPATRQHSVELAPREAPEDSSAIVLSYLANSDGDPGLVVTPAEATEGRLSGPLQPGSEGGGVFDRSGAFLGVVGHGAETSRRIAGIVPPMSHPFVASTIIAAFTGTPVESRPSFLSKRTAGEIATASAAAIVPVSCAP